MELIRIAAATALLLAAGCGSGKDATPAAGSATSSAPAAPAAAKPACPATGHWTECQVFLRLDQAGVAPRRDSVLPGLPSLGVSPTIYMLGNSGLAVYLYPDTLARWRAARSLDTLHFIAPSASLTMRGEATAIENDNLLALFFSKRDQQRERVSDALMAGAPQPPKGASAAP